jgi:hypothetical protein
MLRCANDALQLSNRNIFTISVTEEKICNSFFNNPNWKKQSLFIQRDLADLNLPSAKKRNFVDTLNDSSMDHNATS